MRNDMMFINPSIHLLWTVGLQIDDYLRIRGVLWLWRVGHPLA
jgi:hypothetical protein